MQLLRIEEALVEQDPSRGHAIESWSDGCTRAVGANQVGSKPFDDYHDGTSGMCLLLQLLLPAHAVHSFGLTNAKLLARV